jgi:DnaJ-domain-containing protein 1
MTLRQEWLLKDLKPKNRCNVDFDGVNLVFTSPYDRGLVAQLKALIPYADRRWDPDQKAWLVRPDHGTTLQSLCDQFFNEQVQLPDAGDTKPKEETRIFEIRYIGTTKDRGDAERSAFGLVHGEWSVMFPESVLRDWFEVDPAAPTQAETLYSVLGAKKSASDDELKSAFRRMARQWHPDVCKEPNATEVFQRINKAYQILSDPSSRGRYDAGLALEASLKSSGERVNDLINSKMQGYRSPLRCGWLMVNGYPVLGRFEVTKILDWQDITNDLGQVLVVSWQFGDDHPTERWI